ncbi:hypothetical protein NLJ89_g2366 [Agrocybe chaxingu]|uniref:Uncharacterized protein n=1 Tax=Agrocybe chaxingu TaxID=84603 RepID=A0A9W8K7M4_9AGAR|nr:hypothetical protein NLJ89_g2366 [Agrocybe chaxingu]
MISTRVRMSDETILTPLGDEADEELFEHSKRYLFGDYNYPCIDVSSESARILIWDEEERVTQRRARGLVLPDQRRERAGCTPETRSASMGRIWCRRGGYLIDHDADRVARASAEPKDVVMNPRHGQHRRPRHRDLAAGETAAVGMEAAPGTRIRSPPSLSRNNSRASASPVLPPDAVDLVVEDKQAAEEDQAYTRRKGEPSTRGSGLRKVYRRGFVVDGGGGQYEEGEVEVEEPGEAGNRRVDAGEENIAERIEEAKEPKKAGQETEWTQETEGVAARSGTPPLHARVQAYHYDDVLGSDNPWA